MKILTPLYVTLALTWPAMAQVQPQAGQFVSGVPTAIHSGNVCFTFYMNAHDNTTGAVVNSWVFAIPLQPAAALDHSLDTVTTFVGEQQQAEDVRAAFIAGKPVSFEINVPGLPGSTLHCSAPFTQQLYVDIPRAVNTEMQLPPQ